MKKIGLVEYYSKEKIAPIRQDIADLLAHRRRRNRLFQGVGIRADWIREKKIMEVGPGAGFNSIILAEARPREFVLVEGNPTGMKETKERLRKHLAHAPGLKLKFWQKNLMKLKPEAQFDMVFCEGVLSGVVELRHFILRLAGWVKKGGILFISTVDELSYMPDTLRRILVQLNLSSYSNPYSSARSFEKDLKGHFQNLPGMSRPVHDWIVDNAINPASNLPLYNIPEIVSLLGKQFDFVGSWPRFVEDWRWYKELTQSRSQFNQAAIESYWRKCHNLLFYGPIHPERPAFMNQKLYQKAAAVRRYLRGWENHRSFGNLVRLSRAIREFGLHLPVAATRQARFVRCFSEIILGDKKGAQKLFLDPTFKKWFGRGQQYMALEKVAE